MKYRIYSLKEKRYLAENEILNFNLFLNNDNYKIEYSSNALDMTGKEIYDGDIVTKIYVSPLGEYTSELDDDFIKEVTFFKGAFGIFTKIKFIPLLNFFQTSTGEYISNCGNKINYAEKSILKIIGNKWNA